MALAYTLTALDGLDEATQALYKTTDDGFQLDVTGAVSQSALTAANQKAVDATTEATRRRKTMDRTLGKLGLDDASTLDDTLDALIAGKGSKPNADQEAVIAQMKTAHAAELATSDGRLAKMKLSGAKSQLQAEMQAAGFPAKAAEMFAAANMNRVQLDDDGETRIMAENGNPLAGSGADGFATLGDLSKELAEAMPEFLVDKGKGGGGKPPASGGNAAPNGRFVDIAAKVPGFSDLPLS